MAHRPDDRLVRRLLIAVGGAQHEPGGDTAGREPGGRGAVAVAGPARTSGQGAPGGESGQVSGPRDSGGGGAEGRAGGGVETVADEATEAVVTLQRLFAEERLSLETMDPSLRASVIFAVVSLVGVAAVMSDSHLGGGGIDVGIVSARPFVPVTMATPVFGASVALAVVGIAYVLTGASLVGSPLAFLLVWAIDALTSVYLGAFGSLAGQPGPLSVVAPWARWTATGLLGTLAVVPLASRLVPESWRRDATLRNVLLASYALLLGTAVAVSWGATASEGRGAAGIFGLMTSILFGTLLFPVVPLLVVAATDFSEWGEVAGAHAFSALGSRRPALLPALSAAFSAGVMLLGWSTQRGARPFFSASGLERAGGSVLAVLGGLAACAGLFLLLGLHRWHFPHRISFGALVLACAGALVAVPPLASWLAARPPRALASAAGRYLPGAHVTRIGAARGSREPFTFEAPATWRLVESGSIVALTGAAGPARALVLATVGPKAGPAAYARSEHLLPSRGLRLGAWDGVEVLAADRLGSRSGYIWARPAGGHGRVYLLQEFVVAPRRAAAALAAERAVFLAIARSFRGAGEAPVPLPPPGRGGTTKADRQIGIELGLDLAVATLMLAGGLVRRRAELVTAGVLAATITVFSALPDAAALGRLALGSTAHVPSLAAGGLLLGVGAAGLLVVLGAVLATDDRSALAQRMLAGVAGLEAAAAALAGMNVLYQRAASAPKVGIAAAVVLLAGIAWDVVFSGATTNAGSRTLPREARVLLYFGYLVLLDGMLLYAAHAAGRGPDGSTVLQLLGDPDSFTRNALFSVALPALVVTFLLRLGGSSGRASAAA